MIRPGPRDRRVHPRSIALAAATTIVACCVTAIPSASAAEPSSASSMALAGPTATLLSLGLSPDSLAIAGITPTGFDAIRRAAASNPRALATWAQSRDSLAAAEAGAAAVRARIHDRGVGAADTYNSVAKDAALATAKTSHEESRKAALVAILAPISGSLDATDMAMLAAAIQNSHRPVPPEYRVLALDEAQWEALAEGLRRLETGDAIARADHAALVNWAINQPAVALARARLDALRPGLEAAFTGAMLAEAAVAR